MRTERKAPAYVYTYTVTASTLETVPVGMHLVDKRRDRVKTWDVFNRETGEWTYFTGKRGDRACSVCWAEHHLVRQYDHDGHHGEGAPLIPRREA